MLITITADRTDRNIIANEVILVEMGVIVVLETQPP